MVNNEIPSNHSCEENAAETISTPQSPYRYVGSGLDNVFLVGVSYSICKICHRQSAQIPALTHLLAAIARTLFAKPALLTGRQTRFLRKRLSRSSIDFAAMLSVTPQRLSALESTDSEIPPSRDKLVRMIYRGLSGDVRLLNAFEEPKKFEEWLTSIHGSGATERIVATWQKNHQWKVESEIVAA